jgi:hypothetical protein
MNFYMDCPPIEMLEQLDDGMTALYEELCGNDESEDMEDAEEMDQDGVELHLGALDDVKDARLMDIMFVDGCNREDFGSVERIGYLEQTVEECMRIECGMKAARKIKAIKNATVKTVKTVKTIKTIKTKVKAIK